MCFAQSDTHDYYVRPGLSRKSESSVVGWILCSRKLGAEKHANDFFDSYLTLYEADSFRNRIRRLNRKYYVLPMAEGPSFYSDETGNWDAIWDHEETIISAIFECLCRDAGFIPDEVDSSEEELPLSANELVSSDEELELLAHEIEKLSEKDKLLISMFYVDELSLQEIGEELGVSESCVNLRLQSVIKILRQKLNNKI